MRLLAARLAGQSGVDAFNADIRERRAARFGDALTRDEAAKLFDLERLERVLAGPGAPAAQTDVYSNEHLVRLGDILHLSGKQPVDVAAEQLRRGCTLRFRDIDRFDDVLADFAFGVAEAYAAPAQINVYLTPPGHNGFPPHFDNTDVFIVQVAGSKRWMVHKDYTDRQVLPSPEIAWNPDRYRPVGSPDIHDLHSGDVLYIPRGIMHSALCLKEESMHLTISLASMTMLALLEQELKRLANEDVAFRYRAAWSVSGAIQQTDAISAELRRLARMLADRTDAAPIIADQRKRLNHGQIRQGDILGKVVAAMKDA